MEKKNKKNNLQKIQINLKKDITVAGPFIAFTTLFICLVVTYFAWTYNIQITRAQAQIKFDMATQTISNIVKNIEKQKITDKDKDINNFSIQDLTDQYLYQNVDFEIYKVDNIGAEQLIFDSNPVVKIIDKNVVSELFKIDRFKIDRNSFVIYSGVSKKNFSNYASTNGPKFIVLIGIIGSLSIFGIMLSLLSSRRRATEIANLITKDLKEKDLQLEEANLSLLKETNENNAILSSMVECLIGISNEGKVLFLNQMASVILGVANVEAYGKELVEILPLLKNNELIPKENSPIEKALKGDMGRIYIYDNIYSKDKSGRVFPVMLSAVPLTQKLPVENIAVIVMFHDISTEKAVDRAKTEFVSLAAHQLRMPLTTIRWYTEMILSGDKGKITKGQREFIEEIDESNKRMIFLVNNLLNVSRVRLGTFSIEPTPNDIGKIIESILSEFRPIITKKKMRVETQFNVETKIFNSDSNLMRVILQNLISNSLKYTEESGSIKISVGENDQSFFLTIEDNGYGIPKEDQSKVFDQLYRAENVKTKDVEGSGLGLFMVKTIIEEAGGNISFTSEENKGTKFFVNFPKTGMKPKKGSVKLT